MSLFSRSRWTLGVALFALVALGCGLQSAFDIESGQCFNGAEGEEVSDVIRIECAEPHENEAFLVFDYPDAPQDYPGDDAIEDVVYDRCLPEFKSFVGVDYQESALSFSYLVPSEETWATGDREIVCFITSAEGENLQGSMRGANR